MLSYKAEASQRAGDSPNCKTPAMYARAICTVLLDPRDPLLHSERTQGFAADPDYWQGEVFAYVGLPQNLKDLGDLRVTPITVSERNSHRQSTSFQPWQMMPGNCPSV